MRSEGNPLDLNNLPEDYPREITTKQLVHDTSSSAVVESEGYRKKKSAGGKEYDSSGKIYECRFCSLKFCKSQALGGHMNRHRQERETETLNKARQLVFGADSLSPVHSSIQHLGGQTIPHGGLGYHQTASDPTVLVPFRYPPRIFSNASSSSTLIPSPPSSVLVSSYPNHYHNQSNPNECFMGHVLSPRPNPGFGQESSTNYTCIGAPVGQPFLHGAGTGSGRGQRG